MCFRQDASGVTCPRILPKDLPPKSTVFHDFDLWNDDGTLEAIHYTLYVKTPPVAGVPGVSLISGLRRRIEMLVTMTLSVEMGRLAHRLKLVQVPGVDLDRIDRSALPPGALLANAYGHESGVGEYVIGAILALTREFYRPDKGTAAGGLAESVGGRRRGDSSMTRTGWQDGRDTRLRPDRAERRRRARAFDTQVCAIRRDVGKSAKDDLILLGGAEMLEEISRRSDYIVVSIRELPNVPMTPHVSGWKDGTLDARARPIAQNIRRVAGREVPLNLVSP